MLFYLTFKESVHRLGHIRSVYDSCGPNEWECKKSGICIPLNCLCDHYFEDCGDDDYGHYDQSDEENCGMVF